MPRFSALEGEGDEDGNGDGLDPQCAITGGFTHPEQAARLKDGQKSWQL